MDATTSPSITGHHLQDSHYGDNDDDDATLSPTSSTPTIPQQLHDYLLSLLPLLLSASSTDLRRSLLVHSNASLIARFANDQSLQSVYINKIRQIQSSVNTGVTAQDSPSIIAPTESTRFLYTVTNTLSWHPDNVSSLALIKRVPYIDTTRPISDQVHVLNLFGPALSSGNASIAPGDNNNNKTGVPASNNGGASIVDDEDGQAIARATAAGSANPYGSLHSIVHLAVQPYFEAYISRKNTSTLQDGEHDEHLVGGNTVSGATSTALVPNSTTSASTKKSSKDGNDLSSNTGIPIAKKKFAELELSLLHLQQNVEIPEIVLGVHPVVMRAVEKVSNRSGYQWKPYSADQCHILPPFHRDAKWVFELLPNSLNPPPY
jgi:dynein heavy chain 1